MSELTFSKDALKQMILAEEKNHSLTLMQETPDGFVAFDENEFKYIHFTGSEYIDQEWLKSKIYINPKVKYLLKMSSDNLAFLLMQILPKEYFQTFERMFIIYRKSDFQIVANALYGDKKHFIYAFDAEKLWNNADSIMLFEYNTIIINASHLQKNISKNDYQKAMFHQIFYMMQKLILSTNIFLSETAYPLSLAEENALQLFAGTKAMEAVNYKYH